jgi:uncharacterized membrane protein YqjE
LPTETEQSSNVTTVITEVSERVSILVREEIELARVEMTDKAMKLARGAAAVAAGAVFGIFALVFGLLSMAWGINAAFGDIWQGFVITFVLLLLLTAGAAVFALRMFKRGAPPAPTMAIDEAKKIRDTVSEAGSSG